MTPYIIGSTFVILEEIICIGNIKRPDAFHVLVPFYLKGGTEVVAEIRASGEIEVPEKSTDAYKDQFSERYNQEYYTFKQIWFESIKKIK